MDKLQLGVAYHGNRILRHVESDLRDIISGGFDSVLHMFTHNDMDRHHNIMKEIIGMSLDEGLDVWVDNWGLAGSPGDASHFLSFYPDARQIYNTGEARPKMVCLASPDFVAFTKEWIDMVYAAGGRKLFWDEPCLSSSDKVEGVYQKWTCACPRCRKLFAERYGYEMPETLNADVAAFRNDTILDYFRQVTAYSKAKGMENIVCVMLGDQHGVDVDSIVDLPGLDNVGTDPYWTWHGHTGEAVYKFVYEATKHNLDLCAKHGKAHNVWIQGFSIKAGCEEDIVTAADAIYDAGARSIWAWSYRAAESNDYTCQRPDMAWKAICDAAARLRERERNERLARYRRSVGI